MPTASPASSSLFADRPFPSVPFFIHATDGRLGRSPRQAGLYPRDLRRRPARGRPSSLGGSRPTPSARVVQGYPDGELATPKRGTRQEDLHIFSEERPDVVMSFGPDGCTGHPDHIAISDATTEAFQRFAGNGSPGCRRLTYGSCLSRWSTGSTESGSCLGWNRGTRKHLPLARRARRRNSDRHRHILGRSTCPEPLSRNTAPNGLT